MFFSWSRWSIAESMGRRRTLGIAIESPERSKRRVTSVTLQAVSMVTEREKVTAKTERGEY